MSDQPLQAAPIARAEDHSVGVHALARDEHGSVALESSHFGADGRPSGFERLDEAIVDGWVDSGVAEARHRSHDVRVRERPPDPPDRFR